MKTEETKGRTMLSSSGRNVCISSAVITKNKNKKLLEKKNGCQKSFLFSLFLFGFLLSCLLPPTSGQYQVYRQDPFAMLSATLQVITLLFTRLYAIYLPFCIIYMLLYPFYRIMAYLFIGSLFYWLFEQTYQRAACDGQTINLDCPPGTKIAIQLVQYGRSFELQPEVNIYCYEYYQMYIIYLPHHRTCILMISLSTIFRNVHPMPNILRLL